MSWSYFNNFNNFDNFSNYVGHVNGYADFDIENGSTQYGGQVNATAGTLADLSTAVSPVIQQSYDIYYYQYYNNQSGYDYDTNYQNPNVSSIEASVVNAQSTDTLALSFPGNEFTLSGNQVLLNGQLFATWFGGSSGQPLQINISAAYWQDYNHISDLIHSVWYQDNANGPATRQVQFQIASDQGTEYETVTANVSQTGPVFASVPQALAFGEGNSPATLAASLSLSDATSTTLASATVQITGGAFVGDGDVLAVDTSGTSISASYNSATETLTLAGSDTLADYQSALQSLTYYTASQNPDDYGSAPVRQVTWTANDGSGSFGSGTAGELIEITAVNNPPTLSNLAGAVFTEEGGPVTLASGVSVTDPDSLNLTGATVSIIGGAVPGDVLSATGTASISVGYDSTSETLTLVGTDTLADYQSVLAGVTFNAGENPTSFGSDPTRTLTWSLNDGAASNNIGTATSTIGIANVNDPPTLSLGTTTAAWTEEQAQPTNLSPSLTVTDPDDLDLVSATVSIVGGSFTGDSLLVAGQTSGTVISGTSITPTFTGNGLVVFSGSDSLADYQSALELVTYNGGENPTDFGSHPTRTLTWTLNDGSGTANGGSQVASATSTIDINNVNDPPILSGMSNASFTEEGTVSFLSPGASISDPDSVTIASATISIVGGTFAGDGDVLNVFPNPGNASISVSYSSTSEVLTLSGVDTLTHYQEMLQNVDFFAGENPTNYGSDPTRTVTWQLNDGGGTANGGAQLSTPVTTTISITNVKDPPTLTNLTFSAHYTEEGIAVTLSPSLSVSDPDNLTLASATVAVFGGKFAGDGDVLSANTSGTSITATYNSSTETLTLSGSDTLVHYQSALASVAFSAGENPTDFGSNPGRSLSWSINDGQTSNGVVATTVSITNVNDAPTLSNVAPSASFTEEGGAVTLSSAVSVTDPDDLNLSSATVKIAGGTFAGDGDVLAATGTASIAVSYNSSTETLTLSGTDTLAHYQSVLDSVTFNAAENPTGFGANPTRTVVWTLNDGSASNNLSASVTETISITNIDDPPTLSNVASSATFASGTVSPSLTVSDPDNLDLASATVQITGGSFAGDGDVLAATTAGTLITASYNSVTQTLTLTGSDTLAHYSQVLDSVSFTAGSNPTNSGSNPTRTLSWVVNDGTLASTTTVTTITIGGLPRNDFNGDGKSDVLWQNSDGLPAIWDMNGLSLVSGVVLPNPGASWTIEASADFNHDGKADIILQKTDGLPEIWLTNGSSVTSTVTLPNPGSSWHVIAAADFNNDGNADILWQSTSGLAAIWEMNGPSLATGIVLPNPGASWHAIGAGDFNGDGKADILWQNSDGLPAIWEMNGGSIVSAAVLPNPGSTWHAIGVGDFNGDGKADILWQNNDGLPAIWEMSGTSIIGAAALPNPGSAWHAIGTSDFNGDGKADILWQNSDGLPAIWEMNGTSILNAAALPNPGSTWHPKDDGPIASDQTGAGPPQPALHRSTPDAASAVPMASAPDTVGLALHVSAPDAAAAFTPALGSIGTPLLAATSSSLAGSPTEQPYQKLFTGG